ncbi:[acyl-carrier-protein] S-malonyltransferase [Thermocatellispora tengchongensis]|uniref:[acyl-carrier-protein] S-malonyltransferase n=1 Tax=Thermocatellispora tengchongensis TaxID=1073253 RepID=A0A840P9R4_9ACTN|nr:ACP S-malonyltransferase [Thermocatellispora tengchongensis]MBB5136022.1 [acyl-carrier-protein] S-malonyltransferase [Thermocatellispora tengchongensis]
MREWCEQAAGWVDLDARELLAMESRRGDPLYFALLRNMVVSLGVMDILAEAGVQPKAMAGHCAGVMPAAAAAGGVDRKDLITLIGRIAEAPGTDDSGRTEGLAQLAFAEGTSPAEIEWFYGDEWPDVYLAADSGLIADGSYRIITVSGYMDDLEKLAARMPRKEQVRLYDTYGAVHSPRYKPIRDHLEPFVRATAFHDPVVPIYCGLQREPITKGEQLAGIFIRCLTEPVWVDNVRLGLKTEGVRLAIAPGPGSPAQMEFLQWPFDVLEVRTPDDVVKAIATLDEYAVG